MTAAFVSRWAATIGLSALCLVAAVGARSQTFGASDSSHVTIPFLASATRLDDLSFEAAECDVDRLRDVLSCRFQQVIFTPSPLAPDTCLVSTNGYERTFTKRSASEWISVGKPSEPCGV